MTTPAIENSEIKHQYINVHFCHAYKIGFQTNHLRIIGDIYFYDKDFDMVCFLLEIFLELINILRKLTFP